MSVNRGVECRREPKFALKRLQSKFRKCVSEREGELGVGNSKGKRRGKRYKELIGARVRTPCFRRANEWVQGVLTRTTFAKGASCLFSVSSTGRHHSQAADNQPGEMSMEASALWKRTRSRGNGLGKALKEEAPLLPCLPAAWEWALPSPTTLHPKPFQAILGHSQLFDLYGGAGKGCVASMCGPSTGPNYFKVGATPTDSLWVGNVSY